MLTVFFCLGVMLRRIIEFALYRSKVESDGWKLLAGVPILAYRQMMEYSEKVPPEHSECPLDCWKIWL